MDKKFTTLFSLLFIILSIGCSNTRLWKYTPEPRSDEGLRLISKKVGVYTLLDRRGSYNDEGAGVLAIYLPLPYATATYDRIERRPFPGPFLFFPCEDMAKAIAEELDSSGIFDEVYFKTDNPTKGELVLRGELISIKYVETNYFYCVGLLAVPLWFTGIPAGKWESELQMALTLEDPETNQILWKKSFKAGSGGVYGMYWNEQPGFYYDNYLKIIMKDVAKSLKRFGGSN